MKKLIAITLLLMIISCKEKQADNVTDMSMTSKNGDSITMKTPFVWEAANLYFL